MPADAQDPALGGHAGHDFDPLAFEPLDVEQLYYAFRFFRSPQAAGPSILADAGANLAEHLALYVTSNCPDSKAHSLRDWCNWIRRIGIKQLKNPFASCRQKYSFWVQLLPDQWWTYMNYGYCPFNAGAASHSDWPFSQEMYRQAVAGLPEKPGMRVLEIGCGRGGGAAFLRRSLSARVLGADATWSNIDFCRRTHRADGLQFLHSAGERLPLPDSSFDAVVNIESLSYFRPVQAFLEEVRRVLKPRGYFATANYGRLAALADFASRSRSTGLQLESQRDVSQNVAWALKRLDIGALVSGQQTRRNKELYVNVFSEIYTVSFGHTQPAILYHLFLFRKQA